VYREDVSCVESLALITTYYWSWTVHLSFLFDCYLFIFRPIIKQKQPHNFIFEAEREGEGWRWWLADGLCALDTAMRTFLTLTLTFGYTVYTRLNMRKRVEETIGTRMNATRSSQNVHFQLEMMTESEKARQNKNKSGCSQLITLIAANGPIVSAHLPQIAASPHARAPRGAFSAVFPRCECGRSTSQAHHTRQVYFRYHGNHHIPAKPPRSVNSQVKEMRTW
jgi:hypothetical protein